MTPKYTSKDIKTLEGIDAIRMRPGMYIGTVDTDGMHHLLLEVISNSIDEVLNGHGSIVKVILSKTSNTIEIIDEGRGIPFGPMENGKEAMIELCSSLHSGGKFGQGGYSVSGGLHGIGLTAVNALSNYFSIQSSRDNKQAILITSKGIVKSMNVIDTKTVKTGTRIIFTPDPEIFKDIKWDVEWIQNKLSLLSFLTTAATFILQIDNQEFIYHSKDGLKDLIKLKTHKTTTLTDIAYCDIKSEDFQVELAFQFVEGQGEKVFAFTNNIPNDDGGTHVTGFKTSLTNFINTKAKELGLLQMADDNIEGDLIRKGMVAAISIKMKETPIFTNQTKDKLQSPSARAATSQAVPKIQISRKDLETIIKKALIEKKADDAAKRAREAAKKVVTGGRSLSMIKDLPEKLVDCNKPHGELYIVEGDSAAGSATEGRDPESQAVLPLRGKVLNTFGKELHEILENQEIKNILTTLGCGIGENFNINNLRYDKIILLADADVDGSHINVLLTTLFMIHLPQLVTSGKIYRAVPPLYRVKTKKETIYIQNDDELKKYIKKHGQPDNLTRFKGLGEQNAEELWDTTLNPEKRTLMQLTVKDMSKTLRLLETLMGDDSSLRREYIMKHAKEML